MAISIEVRWCNIVSRREHYCFVCPLIDVDTIAIWALISERSPVRYNALLNKEAAAITVAATMGTTQATVVGVTGPFTDTPH